MNDIIERLRAVQGDNEDAREAAAAIERLRGQLEVAKDICKQGDAEIERLRAALKECCAVVAKAARAGKHTA